MSVRACVYVNGGGGGGSGQSMIIMRNTFGMGVMGYIPVQRSRQFTFSSWLLTAEYLSDVMKYAYLRLSRRAVRKTRRRKKSPTCSVIPFPMRGCSKSESP